MATSRLEKIGTIYTRTRGLLQSGALNWNDRPLWYDIYEAFPPKEEPRFDRPSPKMAIKEIFYEEDKIRAMLHKKFKSVGTINVQNAQTKSFTQRFIDCYKKLDEQYAGSAQPEKVFEEALEMLKKERESRKELTEAVGYENFNLTAEFKIAQQAQNMDSANVKINVKDIFKE